MAIFNKFYATYYDLIYKDKDYKAEADFFDSIIKKYGIKNGTSILSCGAGTLNHESFLVKKGYSIDGVEISADMVALGKEKIKKNKWSSVSLTKGDMRNFSSIKKYDAVVAMFNIVAYCEGLGDMERFIRTASMSLKTGGVLAFDCWNATVVRKDPPQDTWTKTQSGKKVLYKIVEAGKVEKNNSFTRTAELSVIEGNKVLGKHTEKHTLYSWNVEDIERLAKKYGFSVEIISDFMNLRPIDNTRWSMVVVLKKKNTKITEPVCQLCGSLSLDPIIDLGHHPLADSFLSVEQANQPLAVYPLTVLLCAVCGHAMLKYIVPPKERYQKIDYSYTAGNSKVSVLHFDEMSKSIGTFTSLNKKDLVVDIGSNDGTLLSAFRKNFETKILGIEPSFNISKIAKQNRVPTLQDFFNDKTRAEIIKKGGAKVITATNVFNHITDLQNFTKNIYSALTSDGVFVFEVPYFSTLVSQGAFDTIYLEHISYFNVKPFDAFFKKYSLYIQHLELNDYMGGSIRVYVSKNSEKQNPIISQYIKKEEAAGIYNLKTYEIFMSKILDFKSRLNRELYTAKAKGEKIVAIGAATKGNTLLNYCKIDSSLIEFITDSSPLKVGKFAPGSNIIIRPDSDITPDIQHALILPWNLADFLISKLAHLKLNFIVPKMK